MKSRSDRQATIAFFGNTPTRQPRRTLAMFLRSDPDICESADIPFLKWRKPYAGGRLRMR